MRSPLLLFIVLTFVITRHPAAYAQTPPVEICDNQLDDDNDGYVDCYDTDCQCFSGEDCSVPELKTDFRARLAWQSGQNGPSITAIPVVANMNPWQDSMPEIIVAAAAPAGNATPNKILFFRGDGSNLNSPMTLTVPGGFDGYPVPGPTIGDINGDGRPELIMSCDDRRIRVFRNYTENLTTPMTLWITSSGQLDYEDQKPYLADFDGDGVPEIYAGSDIFKFDLSNPGAPALNKVINGLPNLGRALYNLYQEGSCSPTAIDMLSVAECNGDPDCAGLELVAGPVMYSIDLNPNDGDGYQIKVKRDLNQISPGNNYGDGYTAVADINLDGVLDVVVSGRRNNSQPGVYAWDKNKFLGFFPYPNGNNRSGSLPCIANMYDDRTIGFAQDFPEIVVCNAYNLNCFNLQAAQLAPAAPYWWSLVTKDYSGFTGSSVYDFNGDGVFELVYRDEEHFRILYGGAAPFPAGVDAERNWFKIPCGSITSDEYPVVADVDNDGETEVAVTGYPFSGYNTPSTDYRGRLRVFESDAEPWVPCRNVWNQFNYFVVNVDDDLRIPKQQQLHHLELPGPGSGNRPLNRYLSQRQLLDENFQPFLPVPDALAEVLHVSCALDVLHVDVQVCNKGSHRLPAGTPVAFYETDPTATAAALLGAVQPIPAEVPKDSCGIFQFTVPFVSGALFGVVNDDGSHTRPFSLSSDFPVTDLVECNWINNMFSFDFQPPDAPFQLGPDIRACNDTLVMLNAGAGHLGYRWQDGSADSIFQAQSAGLYWVEISDYCLAKRIDSLQLEVLGNPQVQLDTINGDCAGKQASAGITAGSNFLPLDILWSTGSKNMTLDSLTDGWYAVTVTDAMGCQSVANAWVEAGGWLQTTPAMGSIACHGQKASIGVSVTAGRAPFAYQWSNGSTADSTQFVLAGTYALTVTDADGCSQVSDFVLTQPEILLSDGISVEATCPDSMNGMAQYLGARQGTPPYSLAWSTGSSAHLLNGMPGGPVALTITDANGCAIVEYAEVPVFSAPALNASVSPVSCFGQQNGAVLTSLSGGSPGFGYSWSNSATTPDLAQLGPGNYTLTLTYAGGKCVRIFDYEITEPPALSMSAVKDDPLCTGGSDGQITLTAAGGMAPLHFSWSTGQQTPAISNLSAGTYSTTVTDGNGCTRSIQVSLSEPPPLLSGGMTAEAACPGEANGALHFNGAAQGSPPYLLSWTGGSTGPELKNLSAGAYTITITDAHGCTLAETGTVPAFLVPGLDTVVTPLSCTGLNDGAISVTVSGGTPGFEFSWSNNATTSNIMNLTPGAYQLHLTYADGKCALDYAFFIGEPTAVALSLTALNPLCAGGTDGHIDVHAAGGTPPYQYNWSAGGNTGAVSGLPAGIYTVTVTDAHTCSQVIDAQLTEPPPLVLLDSVLTPARCFGESTGAIDLLTGGGVAPYRFSWSGGQQTEDLTGLPAGQYTLTLTDAHDCPLVMPFLIGQPAKIELQASITADTCHKATGIAAISAVGGIAPYVFAWSNGAANPLIEALAAGIYSLTMTDANGCTESIGVQVPGLGEIPVATPFSDVITCAQPVAGIGVVVDQSGVQYAWSGPGGVFSNHSGQTVAVPGFYQVTVSNNFGCTTVTGIVVTEDRQVPLAEAGAPAIEASCDETTVSLDASGSSFGPDFENRWWRIHPDTSLLGSGALFVSISQPGVYLHIVQNRQNGCMATDSIMVTWADPVIAALRVDSITCFGANNGIIRLENAGGGTPPLYYSIDNLHFGTTPAFYNLAPGIYPVSVRDDQGCIWESQVQLIEPDSLGVDLTASDTVLELGRPLQLIAHLSPPDADLQAILWAPSADFDFAPMALRQTLWPKESAGFSVTVVDARGCVATDRVEVRVDNNHIYVPNVIYPGSDDNGAFTIFSGDGVLEIQLLRIFDRWGNQVFENRHFPTNEMRSGWTGDFRNEPVNPGVFAWYAEVLLRNGRTILLKGDVTVVR